MDLRKEILTGMLRTTGSKRVSVIIQDKKGRYLIAERAGVAEEPIEFPSFSCKDTRLPEEDEGITLVTEGIKEVIGIEIKDPMANGNHIRRSHRIHLRKYLVLSYALKPQKNSGCLTRCKVDPGLSTSPRDIIISFSK